VAVAVTEWKWAMRKVESEALGRIVSVIVHGFSPRQIILFGSAARDTMGPDSDLDLLVVFPDGTHRRKTAQKIYRALLPVGFAADIVVVTQRDLSDFSDDAGSVISSAYREGRTLYATPQNET